MFAGSCGSSDSSGVVCSVTLNFIVELLATVEFVELVTGYSFTVSSKRLYATLPVNKSISSTLTSCLPTVKSSELRAKIETVICLVSVSFFTLKPFSGMSGVLSVRYELAQVELRGETTGKVSSGSPIWYSKALLATNLESSGTLKQG